MEINYWQNIISGDKEAFLTVYHKYYRALFSYGFSLTADRELTKDCIQELFLDIWSTRSTLNKDVENIQSYLFTWLRRKISRKQLRLAKDKTYQHSVEGNERKEFCYEELLIAFQITEEKKEQLTRALATLTKKQLEIIRLKFFENLSYTEISAKTSLTTRTVYNIIHIAITRLREIMTILL
jgi:RNA polymerase sigma-70 factor (ECF subfamily)